MRNLPLKVKSEVRSQKSEVRLKIKNFKFLFVVFTFYFLLFTFPCYAAPCYGTRMPGKFKLATGLESYTIFKRYLGDNNGKLRSAQYFWLLSLGLTDWLSIDLKGGTGDIKQHPVGSDEVRYQNAFAGGYGLRVRLYGNKKAKIVFGFQHISVHPYSKEVNGVRNRAILDDWQTSLLASYGFKFLTPYLGTRWSRLDYIHKYGDERSRVMSDRNKSIGFIYGMNIPIGKKAWINLEGQAFDSEALAFSINYDF